MYKGFFEDVEYVMGLIFKPFEGCCGKDGGEEDDEEKKCGMGCDGMPCCKKDDDEDDDEEDDDEKDEPEGDLFGPGPFRDIMKCLFDASDIDYDYED